MTGLEALNKFVNIFAEYCVKTQHQEMNATNMQTAVEYLARSEECRTIEKTLKALNIIKKFIWVEDGILKCGRYADIEIELKEEKQAGFCMRHNIRLMEEQHSKMMKKRNCETCKHFIKIGGTK